MPTARSIPREVVASIPSVTTRERGLRSISVIPLSYKPLARWRAVGEGIVVDGGVAMKKFLLNGSFLSAIFSVFGLVKATVSGKRDWKLALLWISWIVSLVAIIAAITDPDEDDRSR
jgi:hypothetical protein